MKRGAHGSRYEYKNIWIQEKECKNMICFECLIIISSFLLYNNIFYGIVKKFFIFCECRYYWSNYVKTSRVI